MRVISGSARGLKLKSLEGISTRPSADRVKESLFNIITLKLNGANVLDVFSGTGALSIESISRGANSATLIDNNRQAVDVIKYNISKAKMNEKVKVVCGDFEKVLNKLNDIYDIIFLDPPYSADLYIKSLEIILKLKLLKRDGIIIAEHESKDELPNEVGELTKYDVRGYGRTAISFYKF